MDNWGHTALRVDADTGYVGVVQAFKLTGLSTIKSAATAIDLPAAGRLSVKERVPARNQANSKGRTPAPIPVTPENKGSADKILENLLDK
jgi:hypothetical protein